MDVPSEEPQAANALLSTAQTAAKARDPVGMIEALYASGFLAGLRRRLQTQWPRMPPGEIDDCIAEASNAAYEKVSAGHPISQLAAWLWKASRNLASDRWARLYRDSDEFTDDHDLAAAEEDADERAARDASQEQWRTEAVRLARELMPAVGTGQVRDVMELLIDAANAGEPDLPPETVGEILGITASAARSLMSRGLSRLRAAAAQHGLHLTEPIANALYTRRPDISQDDSNEPD